MDEDGETCFLLKEQYRGYKNEDATRKKQKALPMMVLRKMWEIATTEWESAVAWLLIGAIFFAMRSCEYLETTAEESNRRTKILRLKNFKFRVNGKMVDWQGDDLHLAEIVLITFEFQKNDKRDTRVHMFRTDDKVLNPVIAWANVIYRLRSRSDISAESKVCSFWNGIKWESIKGPDVRIHLKSIIDLIGEDILGFTSEDAGLHSIRSGGAMAMFLSRVPVVIIMKIGRWSSDAFLEYIRDQVENFTMGVSQQMLANESFFNLRHESGTVSNPAPVAFNKPNNEDGVDVINHSVDFATYALTSCFRSVRIH